ncbi:phosphoenolpyruvate-dependent sugar phosphotransferase system eiia 2 [Lucifera butyrica]|uniref:Ascorbate-specific PTS system EIIA component n=1 Tax=Lucifera butyrica TaxID=1351585 RepID=A0A498RI97_9FIRM|nr:PTS sugar transporter subunit IIA [Lucifera butyrica]VBB09833.1 phosphoenolpyruvate-dependent sugar phosphotransferase system eiia 2 [Lucifera butyrica]
MFKELMAKERVTFADGFDSWEDAVRAAARPLLRDGAIEETYIDSMIACINQYGPYIVIAPDIAMPHAQGGSGVRENAVSFMKVSRPVHFSDSREHDARLLFVLASVDNTSHLGMLQTLVEAISDEKFLSDLLQVEGMEELRRLIA